MKWDGNIEDLFLGAFLGALIGALAGGLQQGAFGFFGWAIAGFFGGALLNAGVLIAMYKFGWVISYENDPDEEKKS